MRYKHYEILYSSKFPKNFPDVGCSKHNVRVIQNLVSWIKIYVKIDGCDVISKPEHTYYTQSPNLLSVRQPLRIVHTSLAPQGGN